MPNIDEAIDALLAYQQADMEGVMVLTSRQAIHEVADELKRLRGCPAQEPTGSHEAEIVRLIEVLRADEGDSVTILCDNPDFNGQPNCAIECCGDWTGWLHKRFAADTLLDTLSMAVTERRLPSPREVIETSNGHHWVKRFNYICCRDCGFLRRPDDQNAPCKGVVSVGPRADVVPAEGEIEKLKNSCRELAAACQQRAAERDKASGDLLIEQAIDCERRDEIAKLLGVSGANRDWKTLLARLNECLTTLRGRSPAECGKDHTPNATTIAAMRELDDRSQPETVNDGLGVDPHHFSQVYNFCFDGGGIYTPTDRDKAMIEDAINCYIAECQQIAPAAPKSLHWLGDRQSADATGHAVDRNGCVLYFEQQDDCLEFMRRLSSASLPSTDKNRSEP